VIVGVLAFSWGRDGERDSKRAAEYENYAERRVDAFCGALTGRDRGKCFIEQQQAAKDAYKSQRDLEAQRDMSLWALAVFIISAITACLTLWALWYVRGTLMATREALEDTGDATKAMVEQNRLTIEGQTARIIVQPLEHNLMHYSMLLGSHSPESSLNERPKWEFDVKNIGSSTAEIIGGWHRLHVYLSPELPLDAPARDLGKGPSPFNKFESWILAAGEQKKFDPLTMVYHSNGPTLSQSQWSEIRTNMRDEHVGLLLYGVITYRDKFDRIIDFGFSYVTYASGTNNGVNFQIGGDQMNFRTIRKGSEGSPARAR